MSKPMGAQIEEHKHNIEMFDILISHAQQFNNSPLEQKKKKKKKKKDDNVLFLYAEYKSSVRGKRMVCVIVTYALKPRAR